MLLLLSWLTWTPMLTGIGGLAALGLIGPMFGAFKQWTMLARLIGLALICLHCFLWGFRTADESAEQKAKIGLLQSQVTHLTSQLAAQKDIADFVSRQRAALLTEKAEANSLADQYKAELDEKNAKAPANATQPHPCAIDDRDLRFYRSLHAPPKSKP